MLKNNNDSAKASGSIEDKEPFNFSILLVTQLLTNLGDALINPKVTLPWILQSIGVPIYLLGWLVPIRESGSLLPQLIMANFIQNVAFRKWVWVVGSCLQSLSIIGIGVTTLFFEGALAGWFVLALIVLFSLARGLNSIASKDVLGKVVSKERRGRVTGWSGSAAGLVTVGIALAMLMSFVLDIKGDAVFYGWSLVAAAMMWLLAALIYSQVVEPRSEVKAGQVGLLGIAKELTLLKTDKVFRQFVLARSLLLCTALSAPYYVLVAQNNLGDSLWVLGMFMLASGLAALVSSPFWGLFSDYSSRKVMMFASLLSVLVGVLLFFLMLGFPTLTNTVWLIPALYFVLSVAHQGIRTGRKTYLVNMAEGNKRTSYVAVSNTAIGIMLLVMSLVGVLTHFVSLEEIILVFSIMTAIGMLMTIKLPEI